MKNCNDLQNPKKFGWNSQGYFFHEECLPDQLAMTKAAGEKPEKLNDKEWELELRWRKVAMMAKQYPIAYTGLCTKCMDQGAKQ